MKAVVAELIASVVLALIVAVVGACLTLGFNALFNTSIPPYVGAALLVGALISAVVEGIAKNKKRAEAK